MFEELDDELSNQLDHDLGIDDDPNDTTLEELLGEEVKKGNDVSKEDLAKLTWSELGVGRYFWILPVMLVILVLVILVFLLVNKPADDKNPKTSDNEIVVSINDETVKLEVADDDSERTKGLSQRRKLKTGTGMIFIFDDEEIQRFWMKDTKVPLDMIFLDEDHVVVDFIRDAEPCLDYEKDADCVIYESLEVAKYVIEMNAGFVKENKVKIGDKIELPDSL